MPLWHHTLHLLQGFYALHRPSWPHFLHPLVPRTALAGYKSEVGFDHICMHFTWRQNADWKDRCFYSKFCLSWYRVRVEEGKVDYVKFYSLSWGYIRCSSWQFRNCLLPWGFQGSEPLRPLWKSSQKSKRFWSICVEVQAGLQPEGGRNLSNWWQWKLFVNYRFFTY